FPATSVRYQITTGTGHHPLWLPPKERLSDRVGNTDQVVVEVHTTSGFSVGNPAAAIAGGMPTNSNVMGRSFDITRDGSAFLTVAPISGNESGITPVQEIRIVQNWTEELKRLVPAK